MRDKPRYYGKYRAIVSNNNDPDYMGKIKVKCPTLLGDFESSWCLPCLPFFSEEAFIFRKPKVGETVWVEFEEGDLNYPIWVGNWVMPNTLRQIKDNEIYSNCEIKKI